MTTTSTALGTTLATLCLLASAATADIPGVQWDERIVFRPRLVAGGSHQRFDVATNAAGDVLATGLFHGSTTIGGSLLTSSGGADVFLARYTATGVPIWGIRAGGTELDEGLAVATDPTGGFYATGVFGGTATFESTSLSSAGDSDLFLARYDDTGALEWVFRMGGPGGDEGNGVAVDAAGNAYLAGSFVGSADFGDTTLTATAREMFVAKYDSMGNRLWIVQGQSTGFSSGRTVAVDFAGNCFVAGLSSGQLDLGGEVLTLGNAFLAKLDTDGNVQWAREDAGGGAQIFSLATDGTGACYATGRNGGTITFGGVSFSKATLYFDGFLLKYDADGVFQWLRYMRSLTGSAEVEGHDVAVTSSDECLVVGEFFGSASVGDSTLTTGSDDRVFLARYDAGGNFLCLDRIGDCLTCGPSGGWHPIAVDGADNILALTGERFNALDDSLAFHLTKLGAGPTSREVLPRTPRELLEQNHPNPFNPATTIGLRLPRTGQVRLVVFDAAGRSVRTLFDGSLPAGAHEIRWDGRDDLGRDAASGVYFYRLEAGGTSSSRRMLLLQ